MFRKEVSNTMEFGKNLIRLCESKGWTIARVAKASKIPKQTLHGWTTGRSALDLQKVRRVALVLEVPLYELLFGESDPNEIPTDEILRELFTGDVRVSIHRIERKQKRKT